MPDPGGLRTPQIEFASMLAKMLSECFSIGKQLFCVDPGNPASSRMCVSSEEIRSRHISTIAREVLMSRFRWLNSTLALSQKSDGLYYLVDVSEQAEVIAAASSTLAIQLHLMLSYLLSLLSSRLIFFSGLTSLCSFYLSVISALVFLLSLPLTSQVAFGMNLFPSS